MNRSAREQFQDAAPHLTVEQLVAHLTKGPRPTIRITPDRYADLLTQQDYKANVIFEAGIPDGAIIKATGAVIVLNGAQDLGGAGKQVQIEAGEDIWLRSAGPSSTLITKKNVFCADLYGLDDGVLPVGLGADCKVDCVGITVAQKVGPGSVIKENSSKFVTEFAKPGTHTAKSMEVDLRQPK